MFNDFYQSDSPISSLPGELPGGFSNNDFKSSELDCSTTILIDSMNSLLFIDSVFFNRLHHCISHSCRCCLYKRINFKMCQVIC
jgi:hypothetical protein